MTHINTDAERGLLACIMLDQSQELYLQCITAGFTEGHFEAKQHQVVWESMGAVYDAGQPIDLLTVIKHLQGSKRIESAGGIEGVSSLASSVETMSHARIWLKEVAETKSKREIERLATLIQAYQQEPDQSAQTGDLIARLQEAYENALVIDNDGDWVKSIDGALKRASDLIEGRQSAFEVHSPFPSMDRFAGKWQIGEYIILSGLSGGGKTALACNLAIHFARQGKRTAFFSLEMSDWKLIFRMASSLCRIPSREISKGHNPHNAEIFVDQLKELRGMTSIKIFERKMDARSIEAGIRMLHRKWGLEVVFIDYLQLIDPFSSKDNREQQVARISRMLKRLTRELGVMIVVLAQLNKDSEREKRKPKASDLRESQAPRHDCDRFYIVFKPTEGKPKGLLPGANQENMTSVYDVIYYVDKNRDNETGQMVWLKFFTNIQLMQEIQNT